MQSKMQEVMLAELARVSILKAGVLLVFAVLLMEAAQEPFEVP